MLELYDQIEDAVSAIKARWDQTPRAGIILGTGLGGLVDEIHEEASLDYEEIPNFPHSTAVSHRGRLVCGTLSGLPVMAMEGRSAGGLERLWRLESVLPQRRFSRHRRSHQLDGRQSADRN